MTEVAQHTESGEAREDVIRDDHVPGLGHRRQELRLVLDAAQGKIEATPSDLSLQQESVVG